MLYNLGNMNTGKLKQSSQSIFNGFSLIQKLTEAINFY